MYLPDILLLTLLLHEQKNITKNKGLDIKMSAEPMYWYSNRIKS